MGWLVASATFILLALLIVHWNGHSVTVPLRLAVVCLVASAVLMAIAYGTTP